MEDFPEIAPVQTAGSGHVLHGNIVLEILLDEGNRFLNIEIPQTVSLSHLGGGGGAHKFIYEQIEMSD